jgi:hypothetical protein
MGREIAKGLWRAVALPAAIVLVACGPAPRQEISLDECLANGVAYYKEVVAYPTITAGVNVGRASDDVIAERCSRTTTAFPQRARNSSPAGPTVRSGRGGTECRISLPWRCPGSLILSDLLDEVERYPSYPARRGRFRRDPGKVREIPPREATPEGVLKAEFTVVLKSW